MMRKIAIAALLLAALPWAAGAQVEKQVEVTKAYVPSVESASKLAVTPDMTDTTKMRPEIDYTITPLSLQTALVTRPIRPAKVTYWEFNRPLPFYLKVGAGYPLNSVLDFYASTQNPGTGYAVGYVNHEGRYSDIGNNFAVKNNSLRMTNRIGAAAGKYFGKRTLEGDISYENRLYHRYGSYIAEGESAEELALTAPGARVNYGDANVSVRFGDDFQDLSRVNFEIALHGGMFFDHSDAYDYGNAARQSAFGASAKVARGFGGHRISAEVSYERLAGQKAIADYREQLLRAGLRYGYEGGMVRFEAGADYVYDRNDSLRTRSYVLPFLRLDAELGTPGLKPFLEIDGDVRDNSYRSLTMQNPYVQNPTFPSLYSTVSYNGRLGVGGSLWRNRLTYRVYAALSIRDNNLYWTNRRWMIDGEQPDTEQNVVNMGIFTPLQARQTVTSFNGEAEWRPVSVLLVSLGVHGYLYNDDTKLNNGCPGFRSNVGVRYEGRKFAFGVSALMQSEREWSTFVQRNSEQMDEPFTAPFAVDLRADVVWKVSGKVSLFAEGRNLANRVLYEFPWYPEYGANFTVGVKANF